MRGLVHCRLDYGMVWRERYADAITDTVGQPLSRVGRYSGPNVDCLSRMNCDQTPDLARGNSPRRLCTKSRISTLALLIWTGR